MTTSTTILESQLKSFMGSMVFIRREVADLYKLYFAEVSPDSVYTALANADAATFSTKLTKNEVINSLTFMEQLNNFFGNSAVTQSDYLATIDATIYGADQYTSPGISPAIESYGERVVEACTNLLQLFKDAQDILDVYFDTQISAAVGAVTGDDLPWYDFSKTNLTGALSLIENYKKMINNEAVTAGDYESTIATWRKLI